MKKFHRSSERQRGKPRDSGAASAASSTAAPKENQTRSAPKQNGDPRRRGAPRSARGETQSRRAQHTARPGGGDTRRGQAAPDAERERWRRNLHAARRGGGAHLPLAQTGAGCERPKARTAPTPAPRRRPGVPLPARDAARGQRPRMPPPLRRRLNGDAQGRVFGRALDAPRLSAGRIDGAQ